MPTDTIYGICGQALNKTTVERIYGVKKRTPEKSCIILIGGTEDLKKFSVEISLEQEKVIEKFWPGPVSIIFDCKDDAFEYLQRGTSTLAFRLPLSLDLQELLKKTGPLIVPSANPEGKPPAESISQAKEYFVDLPDLYIDGGQIIGKPSKLIQLHKDGSVSIIRE
jgi:L-threonylcarbamoyladenylate synthase